MKKLKFYLTCRIVLGCLILLHIASGVAVSARAAEVPVSGRITDEKGEALPGVSIVLKGTTRGTTTDGNGQFKLVVPNEKSVLIVSFVGYLRQEVTVNNRSVIDVQLQSDDKSLEEVVVVGYGTQKKVNLTGAVSTVESKAIENRPVSNLANALQGVTPGLNITRASGQPGRESMAIQIRGVTSANGNVNPLVILDGVSAPITTLQTLNPNDVESISVLKDAAAAAIYGAQAAGGVILVTTKKGKAGKVTFDYLAQYGTDWSINTPGRMSLLDEANFSNLARKNSGSNPEYTDDDLQRIRDGIPYVINPADTGTYLYYNQQSLSDQILKKNTMMATHNLTARGGTDKLNFLISGGYYEKQGLFKVGPDNYKRYNLRVNLGAQLTKHLSLDARLSYTLDKTRSSSADVSGSGLIYQINRLRTRTPFFTPEGRYNGAGSAATAYATLESGGYNNYDRNFFDNVFTLQAANFVKGLTLRAVAGVQYRLGNRAIFNRTVPLWGKSRVLSYLNQPNSYQLTNEVTKNTNLQFLANYDVKVGDKHNFGFFAGYQWEDYRFQADSSRALTLVSNDLPTLNLGDDRTKVNGEVIQTYAYQSVFGRFNYNYADKYLFEATIRQDESSKLAPGLRTKVFPSASAGWNMHREGWFSRALPFFSEFKLRGSWGRLGGALGSNLGYYDYLSQLSKAANLVLGDSRTSYIYQNSIPSGTLSWETIETSDVGIDMAFFQNRLQFNGDYYVKFNRNMLTPQQLPGTIGVGTPRKNNGELKSWGWEAEIRYRDRIGKDFTYSIAANLSDNQNKLISYSGRTVVTSGTNNLIEGFPINTIWGYQTAGYFQTADEVKAWAFQDSRTGAGDVKYIDQDGDKRLTVGQGTVANRGDLLLLGTTQPRYLFGFTFGAQWKGFDMTIFLQGVGKRNYRPNTESIAPLLVTWKQALAIHGDYWTPENQGALFPRPYVGATHNYLSSDKWVLNASYMRLKNFQVGYTLPSTLTQRIGIARARFFFSGQDLFTISGLGKFQGYFDPEARDGVDNDYPYFATASVGLNVSF
ncbi:MULTISPECIES: SusC/RagA family TonB-linked outer membrane protein [Spirosoma]|uniref:TonB-dependent receptor n=1 Tax=Spirosoma liriopis TaxID=2937440 RepID=A0ABT0HFK4_9BACT|nr:MULTISPECIES: TonB-dependent receptor [Spirosoma]MCK8490400.1 TonB-dependent receptor [Spirosoma liriopis]UHG89771.1 TonB-dependent receptor [Spirosoma oryzicola]